MDIECINDNNLENEYEKISADEQAVVNNFPESSDRIRAESDLETDDVESLKKHNQRYTDLLDVYVSNLKTIYAQKKIGRVVVLIISLILLIVIPISAMIVICISFNYTISNPDLDVFQALPELIVALVGMITTLLTVPHLITEYLFNKEEEQTMAAIIGKIQDYDMNVREKRNPDSHR